MHSCKIVAVFSSHIRKTYHYFMAQFRIFTPDSFVHKPNDKTKYKHVFNSDPLVLCYINSRGGKDFGCMKNTHWHNQGENHLNSNLSVF